MKNIIIVLLFLFTTTNLLAVNVAFEESLIESSTESINHQLINELNLHNDFEPNCIIDIEIVNSDGEKTAHIHVEATVESHEECDTLRRAILDMATE
jgi:hypothetical protein